MTDMEQIADDLLCISCGYNLRHAPSDGRCSECGVDVARSIDGDQLYRADRRWLKKILAGLGWTVAAEFVALLEYFFLPARVDTRHLVGNCLNLLLLSWGSWLVLAREKRWAWPNVLGRGVTIAIFVGGAAGMIQLAEFLFKTRVWIWPAAVSIVGNANFMISASMLQRVIVLVRTSEFARRSWSPSLRWQCVALGIAEVIISGLLLGKLYAWSMHLIDMRYGDKFFRNYRLAILVWAMVVLWLTRSRIAAAMKMAQKIYSDK